jgi:hypothetical protein
MAAQMNCAESTYSTNSSICSWPIVESFQWGNLQPFSEFQRIAKMRMTDEQEYAARSQLEVGPGWHGLDSNARPQARATAIRAR